MGCSEELFDELLKTLRDTSLSWKGSPEELILEELIDNLELLQFLKQYDGDHIAEESKLLMP